MWAEQCNTDTTQEMLLEAELADTGLVLLDSLQDLLKPLEIPTSQ